MLSGKDYIRYSRQIMLEEHGEQGQEKLLAATAVIIGLGGLGCPAAQYLAAAGVGNLILVDNDQVETSNLHRQVLYTDAQAGINKAEAALERLKAMNPGIEITAVNARADASNLTDLADSATVILDCTDNVETRYAINQAAYKTGTPLIIGAAIRYEAQIISFDFTNNPEPGCYQCLVANTNDEAFNCATSGVIGPVLGIAGSMQALAAIKAITGKNFIHNLWQCFDGRSQKWISLKHSGLADCPVCAKAHSPS